MFLYPVKFQALIGYALDNDNTFVPPPMEAERKAEIAAIGAADSKEPHHSLYDCNPVSYAFATLWGGWVNGAWHMGYLLRKRMTSPTWMMEST